MPTPLEEELERRLSVLEPELFMLRRRVIELEAENMALKARLPKQEPPRPAPPETGFAFGISDATGTRTIVVPGVFAKFGTHRSCNVQVDGARMFHCAVEREPTGGVVILDLGTREGTHLNGLPIVGKTAIKSGDVIGIGSAQIVAMFR